jgi:hypothetical protein
MDAPKHRYCIAMEPFGRMRKPKKRWPLPLLTPSRPMHRTSAETRTEDDRLATHAHSLPAATLHVETRGADRADQGPSRTCGNMAFSIIAPLQPQRNMGFVKSAALTFIELRRGSLPKSFPLAWILEEDETHRHRSPLSVVNRYGWDVPVCGGAGYLSIWTVIRRWRLAPRGLQEIGATVYARYFWPPIGTLLGTSLP